MLFYTQYPPEEYQRHPLRGIRQGRWQYTDFSFGRYRIDSLRDIESAACENSLLIALAGEAEDMERRTAYRKVHVVSVPEGRRAIELFECR